MRKTLDPPPVSDRTSSKTQGTTTGGEERTRDLWTGADDLRDREEPNWHPHCPRRGPHTSEHHTGFVPQTNRVHRDTGRPRRENRRGRRPGLTVDLSDPDTHHTTRSTPVEAVTDTTHRPGDTPRLTSGPTPSQWVHGLRGHPGPYVTGTGQGRETRYWGEWVSTGRLLYCSQLYSRTGSRQGK